jgi:hypothetical protein
MTCLVFTLCFCHLALSAEGAKGKDAPPKRVIEELIKAEKKDEWQGLDFRWQWTEKGKTKGLLFTAAPDGPGASVSLRLVSPLRPQDDYIVKVVLRTDVLGSLHICGLQWGGIEPGVVRAKIAWKQERQIGAVEANFKKTRAVKPDKKNPHGSSETYTEWDTIETSSIVGDREMPMLSLRLWTRGQVLIESITVEKNAPSDAGLSDTKDRKIAPGKDIPVGEAKRVDEHKRKAPDPRDGAFFDGKSLDGWQERPEGHKNWSVMDTVITYKGKVHAIGWAGLEKKLPAAALKQFKFSFEARGTAREFGLFWGSGVVPVTARSPQEWHTFALQFDGVEGQFVVDGKAGRKAQMEPRVVGLWLRTQAGEEHVVEYRNVRLDYEDK